MQVNFIKIAGNAIVTSSTLWTAETFYRVCKCIKKTSAGTRCNYQHENHFSCGLVIQMQKPEIPEILPNLKL